MIRRGDSLEMENQITSMLEEVLKEDSETEGITIKKEEIKRKDKKRNTMYNTKSEGRGNRLFAGQGVMEMNAPRILLNSQPCLDDNVNNYNQFVNEMRNTPYNSFRTDKRTNTINYTNMNMCNNHNGLFNMSNQFNFSAQKACHNHNDSNSTNTSYMQNSLVNENVTILFSLNEFDEILERKVRVQERLNWESYEMMKGSFFKIITSQNGSRVLQKSLRNTPKDILAKVFYEIEERICELMVDSYANYFCQKFFQALNEEERRRFLFHIRKHIVEIGNSKVGTYPLQAIIDLLATYEEKMIFIDSMKGKVVHFSLDAQGTHVIEKMLTVFDEDMIIHIYQAILNDFIMLGMNVNGLCVVKKAIIHAQHIETLNIIRELLMENALDLIQSPFGNYALQIAFEYWSFDFCFPIIEKFFGHFYELSLQKYSSNVIEKCFEKNEEIIITAFTNEICQDHRIIDLMKNSYGNYVVQKALKIVSGMNKIQLSTCIQNNLDRLSDKKLVNKWKTIVNNSLHLNIFNNEMNVNRLNISNSSNDSSMSNNSYNNVMPTLNPQKFVRTSRFTKSLTVVPHHNMQNNLFSMNNNNINIFNNINMGMPNVTVQQMFMQNAPVFYKLDGRNFNLNN